MVKILMGLVAAIVIAAGGFFGFELYMQLARLLRRDVRRRSHQQVFGPLVHREQQDFAQVGGAAA